jgi:hypothetical protein
MYFIHLTWADSTNPFTNFAAEWFELLPVREFPGSNFGPVDDLSY